MLYNSRLALHDGGAPSKLPTHLMPSDPTFRRITTDDDVRFCATLMCGSEPWLTLHRDYAGAERLFCDPGKESWLVEMDGAPAGFIVLEMQGAFVGYIKSICIAPEFRGSGLGTRTLHFAEQRIFSRFPNVFLCVSSFNTRARKLYERLGYELVGELRDYVITGASELLMRKTRGPLVSGAEASDSPVR